MSKILNISIDAWLQRLRDEDLLHIPDHADDDGAHGAHLEGFLRAVALAETFDDRQLNRLRVVTNELIALNNAFATSVAKVFYGAELFEVCLQGLYGPTLGTALLADRKQRRMLIESTHRYEGQCLAHLISDTLSEVAGNAVHWSTWQSAFDENLLKQNDRVSKVGDRTYERQRSAKYWLLEQPSSLAQDAVSTLLNPFPKSLLDGIGAAQVLISTSTAEQKSVERTEFRQLMSSHGLIRVISLNHILKQGTPLLTVIDAQAHELLGYTLPNSILRQLSARLEGYSWSQGRQSLVCLLSVLESRGILTHFTDEALERAITDLEHIPESQINQPSQDSLDSFLAEALLKGQTLPELLTDFERQAYVYAARVASVKRPGQNIRVQDLALILKTPRQTVSRKWHAFQISSDEYLLTV